MTTELIRGLQHLSAHHQGAVITIGNFDGVHKGHQALLEKVKERAKERGVPSSVMTFEPQPTEFFLKARSAARLTRFREKFSLLKEFNIDKVFVIHFDKHFAAFSAESFIDLLAKKLKVKEVIVGDDFHFGSGRKGDVKQLKEAGAQFGFSVMTIPDCSFEGERISSTRVRLALQQGNLALTEKLLGRPYSMKGRVVYGDQRGRVLGFPTANIDLHRQVTPIMGIFIVRLHGLGKQALPGVASIGVRPTIADSHALLEVHIFNFNQTIYGKQVCVEFCEKLRDEERFDTLDLLKEQMVKDAEMARAYFKKSGELTGE